MDEYTTFLSGMASALLSMGYFFADGYQANRINRLNDEDLINETIDAMAEHSYEELINSGEIVLPETLIQILHDWRLYEFYKVEDAEKYYPHALYQTAIEETEKITTIGPISWFTKKWNLKSLRKKLRKSYGLSS